jgi:hypothetical protein
MKISNTNIHSFYTNLIKRLIKAPFVGWERKKDKSYLRINTKDGRKLIVPFNGNIEDVTEITYKELIQNIIQPNNDNYEHREHETQK